MKNTGIVRRLDELGRIVIPREFRKTHRINVGDPLEISAREDGSIVITKVDNSSDLVNLSQSACSSLNAELNYTVAASSFDRFIAAVGHGKSALIEKELPVQIVKMIKNRAVYSGLMDASELGKLPETGLNYIAIAPIVSIDDVFGAFYMLSDRPVSAQELTTLRLVGRIVGDSMQKY